MKRLWVRLTLAFLAVALVAVGLVAVLSARATGEEFRQYVVGQGMMAAQPAWIGTLEGYYARNGSWDGVSSILSEFSPGMGAGMGAAGQGRGGPNLAVADATGRVVASRTGEVTGERLPTNVLAQGSVLHAPNGEIAGTLLNIRAAQVTLDAQGQSFLDQVRASVALSALAAVVLALALGIVVSRWLAAPLVRLTRAATAIAAGDLQQQVAVGGSEELGELGLAFNKMANNLAHAETLRRNMVADVAHELRTPLTVIQGNLQAILDGVYPLDAEQVASLYDETRLLTRLVDDLRDLALADAGQLSLERQPVDLVDLARTAVTNFAADAGAGEIDLRLHAEDDGPIVEGDADRLAQVLRNLIGNALRHTPPRGAVTVTVSCAGQQAVLAVADTGAGIDPEDLPHVFDLFDRGDKSRSRRGGGAGLGLAIARQLVLAHGGELRVESRAGQGSTFTVILPARRC